MSTPSLPDATLGVAGKIGRNFSVVTVAPSLYLTLWVYALYVSGAWAHEPRLGEVRDAFAHWSLAGAAWLALATVLVGLFIHPLQFPTVQLLEGYWGPSRLARAAVKLRAAHYRAKAQKIEDRLEEHQDILQFKLNDHLGERASKLTTDEWQREMARYLAEKADDHALSHAVAEDIYAKATRRFPRPARMMPTRLGNALRAVEDRAGRQYGLDAITVAPHLALIAPESHVAYLHDSREQLDLAVRLCSVSLLATVITFAATLTDGLWLLLALIPYALAYVAYRAAVSAADEFMTAVSTIIDLDRFALYRHLGLSRPQTTQQERRRNAKLMLLLQNESPDLDELEVSLVYSPEEPPDKA
ncbi:hypothetical protein [Amycolatopsis sp. NPDC051102]|uniref:hypothetical protein n=1 Tax=Amycolatopsis sp. NPDC051102 TaxID=3155163 RepID=UPI0034443CA7